MHAFLAFIREQGVIGLAIGFIMGGATSKVVSSFVADIVQPLLGLLIGSTDGLSAFAVGPVHLGAFLVALIDFVIIAAVVFYLFKGLKLDALDAKKQ
jgi:large conductance mechanosensitive channel